MAKAPTAQNRSASALLKGTDPAALTLDTAQRLLALPRDIGRHPETGDPITAGIGRFGAYLKHGSKFTSLGGDDDVLTIGLNRAVTVLAESKTGERRGPQLLRELGAHPGGGKIGLYRGRYGPYVSTGADARLHPRPARPTPSFSTRDEAIALLADKGKATRGAGWPSRGHEGRAGDRRPHAADPRGQDGDENRRQDQPPRPSGRRSRRRASPPRSAAPRNSAPLCPTALGAGTGSAATSRRRGARVASSDLSRLTRAATPFLHAHRRRLPARARRRERIVVSADRRERREFAVSTREAEGLDDGELDCR